MENGDDGALRLVPVAPDRGEPFTLDQGITGWSVLRRLRGQVVTAAGVGWTDCSGSISAPWLSGLLLTSDQAALATPPTSVSPLVPAALVLTVLALVLGRRGRRRTATVLVLTAASILWLALSPSPLERCGAWPFSPRDRTAATTTTWLGRLTVPARPRGPAEADRVVDGVALFTRPEAFWRAVFWEPLTADANDAPNLDDPVKEALARALTEGGPSFRLVDAERESLALGLYAPNPEDDAEGRAAMVRLALLLGVPALPER